MAEVAPLLSTPSVEDCRELMRKRKGEAVEAIAAAFGDAEQLAARLGSQPNKGLEPGAVDAARAAFGENRIPQRRPPSFLELCWDAAQDFILVILLISGLISIGLAFIPQPETFECLDPAWRAQRTPVLHEKEKEEANTEWIEGLAILLAVAVVILVTALNDWQKERQFRGLQARISKEHKATVIRGGQQEDIQVAELVVGDLCCVKYGDMIPADGMVMSGHQLLTDESSMTGESDLIAKTPDADPVLLSGTSIMEGSGKMLVLAVGINSQTGQIMKLMGATGKEKAKSPTSTAPAKNGLHPPADDAPKEVPAKNSGEEEINTKGESSVLQTKLTKLAKQIGLVGVLFALAVVLVMVIRYCVDEFAGAKGREWNTKKDLWAAVHIFIIGITVLVVAIPEGLPLAVTIALAFSVKKMMEDNNLVRHLSACETMGNATTICSDKTGTLTTNRMTTVQLWIAGAHYAQIPAFSDVAAPSAELTVQGIAVNSSYASRIEKAEGGEQPKQLGNKTECGLLGLVLQFGQSYESVRTRFPEDNFFKVFTFNSKRKSMSTVIRLGEGGELRLFSKGASEVVLGRCTRMLGVGGLPEPLGESGRASLLRVIEAMAGDGLRTIGLAYKDVAGEKALDWEDEAAVTSGLTLVAIAGIQDPVRPEVPAAVAQCQRAGITVRMVTGDNVNTARSIAMSCGILSPDQPNFLVLDAAEFNKRVRDDKGNFDQARLDRIWPQLRVLARAQPADKFVLVKGIIDSTVRTNGTRAVVAVTGDGTNDGPALKKADVGFAMGIAGTEVAKEASDIILTDDNFTSIVRAVMWGRNVYDSIAKFIQFQLTVNLVAVTVTLVSACALNKTPLAAIHMLWVNLIMDCLASLALATEKPTPQLLNRKPYGRTKPLISRMMLKNILGQSVYQLIVIFSLIFVPGMGDWLHMGLDTETDMAEEPGQHFTIVFNSFVLMTLFNELNSRKVHGERNVFTGLHRNVYFIGIMLATTVGQIALVQWGGRGAKTTALTADQWLWCVFFGVGALVWQQVVVISVPETAVPQFLTIGGSKEEESPSSLSRDHSASLRRRRSHREPN